MSKKEEVRGTPKNEHVVFSAPVKAQHGDIYKVMSLGVCIEFTDRLAEAESAYRSAATPKSLVKIIRSNGAAKGLYAQIH